MAAGLWALVDGNRTGFGNAVQEGLRLGPIQKAGPDDGHSFAAEGPSILVLVQRCRLSVHVMIDEMLSSISYLPSMIAAIHSKGGNPLLPLADPARNHLLAGQTVLVLIDILICMVAEPKVSEHSRQVIPSVRSKLHPSHKSRVLACMVVFLFLR